MKFTVKFIDLDKTMDITAPSMQDAEEWAIIQLDTWGEDSDFEITPG